MGLEHSDWSIPSYANEFLEVFQALDFRPQKKFCLLEIMAST